MSYLDAKPSDSKESLLADIMSAANQSHMPGLPLRPLGALIVKVADETAGTVADLKAHITQLNEQNANLQWWVVALAVAALIGTVVQTTAAIYALSASGSPVSAQTSAPGVTPAESQSDQQAPPGAIRPAPSVVPSASNTSAATLSSPSAVTSRGAASQPK